jgi:hypothetical protein
MASRKGNRQNNYSSKGKQDAIKRSKSARRDAHFAAGLPLSEWTPGKKVHKKKKDKRQNRRTRRQNAIREGLE